MDHHPNILNNLLANLRKRYFPGQFKDYVQAVGSGDTYLRKLESGAILQPNKENLALLVEAYGKEWGRILTLLTHQISSKAYSMDPQWQAVHDLWDLVMAQIRLIPNHSIILDEFPDHIVPDDIYSCHPDSHFVVHLDCILLCTDQTQLRLFQEDRVSLIGNKADKSMLPLFPYSICFDGVLLLASQSTLRTVTANSTHVDNWNAAFSKLRAQSMSIRDRMLLMRATAELEKDPVTPEPGSESRWYLGELASNATDLQQTNQVLKNVRTAHQPKQPDLVKPNNANADEL